MRIGLVSPYSFSRPGGVQAHVWGLGEYLVGQGHEVDILAPGQPGDIPRHRPAPTFTSAGAAVPIRFNGSVARVSMAPHTAWRAQEWLNVGDFDVVHLHEPLTPSIAWQVLGLAEMPVLATLHTARDDTRLHEASGRVLARRLARIDDAIAVSPAAADLAEAYLPRRPDVVPNAIWCEDFAAEQEVEGWRGGSRPRVTFLGRDEPRKGLDVFLAAAEALTDRVEVDVVVAGAEGTRVPSGCRHVIARSHGQRRDLLAHTDVFVHPALGGESFGIVLVEAMAAGCQVVCSDLPAFRDVVGEAGTTFVVGDAMALADAVVATIAAPRPEADILARARRYDWNDVGRTIVARLERLVRPPIA